MKTLLLLGAAYLILGSGGSSSSTTVSTSTNTQPTGVDNTQRDVNVGLDILKGIIDATTKVLNGKGTTKTTP